MPRPNRQTRRNAKRLARACAVTTSAFLAATIAAAADRPTEERTPHLTSPRSGATPRPLVDATSLYSDEIPGTVAGVEDDPAYEEPFRPGGDPFAPDASEPSNDSPRPLSPQSDASGEADSPSSTSPDPFSRPPRDILRSLSKVDVSLATPARETPLEQEFEERGELTLATRVWADQTPLAAEYRFRHSPLWYEDANLERCGRSCGGCCGCLQPVVSGAYFFGNTALLPYRLVAEPQCTTVPAKPFCPPGCSYSCRDNYLPPSDAAGTAAQTAAVVGLIFLIP